MIVCWFSITSIAGIGQCVAYNLNLRASRTRQSRIGCWFNIDIATFGYNQLHGSIKVGTHFVWEFIVLAYRKGRHVPFQPDSNLCNSKHAGSTHDTLGLGFEQTINTNSMVSATGLALKHAQWSMYPFPWPTVHAAWSAKASSADY